MGFGLVGKIVSVSEFLVLLKTKEHSVLSKGIISKATFYILGLDSFLRQIEGTDSNPLTSYVRSEPTLPHLVKMLVHLMKSSDHDFMSATLWILAAALRALSRVNIPSAITVAKTILNENIKSIYRCLSSGNPGCLTAAMDLLSTMCLESASVSLSVAVLDLRHKGLQQAARSKRHLQKPLKEFGVSPRAAYVSWVIHMLKKADYETRVALSKHPAILHDVISGLGQDEFDSVNEVLEVILEKVVFNEEDNRNLPVAFLRGNQLSKIAKLMSNKDSRIADVAKNFLIRCYSTAGKGLCYLSGPINILRNKLLSDLVVDLDPIANELQDFCLEMVVNCPDVIWAFLSSGKIAFDPSSPVNFALNVSFAIRLLSLLPVSDTTTKEELVPKFMHRTTMSKGLAHDDRIICFNMLLLILAILKRFSDSSLDDDKTSVLSASLPNFQTVYNSWKRHPSTIKDDEEEFLEMCFLEVISLYTRLDLVDKDVPSLKITDFCTDFTSVNLANSVIRLWSLLDPISLLLSLKEVDIVFKICQIAERSEVVHLLSTWIGVSNISRHESGKSLSNSDESWRGILMAICDIFQKPLLFNSGEDPLLKYLGISPEAVLEMDQQVNEMDQQTNEMETEQEQKACSVVPDASQEYLNSVKGKICADCPVDFLNSLLAVAKRARVMDSFSDISPSISVNDTAIEAMDELLKVLLLDFDFQRWLQVICSAVTADNCHQVDLRLLIESGVIGYPIIGLSLSCESLRRISHLILTRYITLLSSSRLRERRQVALLLTSLSHHLPPESPLQPLPRLEAYFYAEALPLLLRAEHPLYRPINELLLASLAVQAPTAFSHLFFDANDEWLREACWSLGWIDRAIGRDGQFVSYCNLPSIHVVDNAATLMMTRVDEKARKLAERIVTKAKPVWLSSFRSLLE